MKRPYLNDVTSMVLLDTQIINALKQIELTQKKDFNPAAMNLRNDFFLNNKDPESFVSVIKKALQLDLTTDAHHEIFSHSLEIQRLQEESHHINGYSITVKQRPSMEKKAFDKVILFLQDIGTQKMNTVVSQEHHDSLNAFSLFIHNRKGKSATSLPPPASVEDNSASTRLNFALTLKSSPR